MSREVGWGDMTRYTCLKCDATHTSIDTRFCGFCNSGKLPKEINKYPYCNNCISKHLEEAHGPVDLV